MTFSLVARCPDTGMFGVVVSSSSPAVAARCAHAVAGVGAVLTQNFTDPSLGVRGLDLLQRGADGRQVVDILSATASDAGYRQLAAVGVRGGAATFTGESCLVQMAHAEGEHAAAIGNLLASPDVPRAMLATYEASRGHLAARLVAALRAGLDAGGEIEPVHSAGLKVVHQQAWPIADLRVDWTEGCPIAELETLWTVWEPRMPLYLARALQPADAPASDDSA